MSRDLTDRTHSYFYKLPPCPDWDPESAESWLTDLAARGLHLSPQGVFGPWFLFGEGAGAAVRYRLEAVGRVRAFSDGENLFPRHKRSPDKHTWPLSLLFQQRTRSLGRSPRSMVRALFTAWRRRSSMASAEA